MTTDTRYFVHPSFLTDFRLTPEAELDSVITRLSYYTLPELRKFFEPMKGVTITWRNEAALPKEFRAFANAFVQSVENPAESRDSMLYALAQIVHRNLDRFLGACRKPVADAFRELARAGSVPMGDIPPSLANSPAVDIGVFALARFQQIDGRNSLVLPPIIREAVGIRAAVQEPAQPKVRKPRAAAVPEVPPEGKYSIESISPSGVCKAWAMAGFVRKQSDKNQPTATEAKTLSSMVAFPKLPEDVLSAAPRPLSPARMFLNVFDLMSSRTYRTRSGQDSASQEFPGFLRRFAGLVAESSQFDVVLMIDNVKHLGGLNYAIDSEGARGYLLMCVKMIKALGAEGWARVPSKMLELRNAMDYGAGSAIPLPVSPRSINVYNTYRGNRSYGYRYNTLDEFADIALPVLRCFLALLCIFGLVELAVGRQPLPVRTTRYSQFDTIDFYRLTPLGRYAFGLTDDVPEYEPYEIENCRLDEVYPFIYVPEYLADMYGPYLKKIGKPIGATRYAVSEETLMHGIRRRSELDERIRSFEEFVGNRFPPVWEELVGRIIKRANSVSSDGGYYISVRLDPNNSELINFAMTNETIRKLCVRGENCTLFIPTSVYDSVVSVFTNAGYLLS